MLKSLESRYTVPSRQHITDIAVPNFEGVKDLSRTEFELGMLIQRHRAGTGPLPDTPQSSFSSLHLSEKLEICMEISEYLEEIKEE
ncbi:uncharacterized [Tachysurus ichikawai]